MSFSHIGTFYLFVQKHSLRMFENRVSHLIQIKITVNQRESYAFHHIQFHFPISVFPNRLGIGQLMGTQKWYSVECV